MSQNKDGSSPDDEKLKILTEKCITTYNTLDFVSISYLHLYKSLGPVIILPKYILRWKIVGAIDLSTQDLGAKVTCNFPHCAFPLFSAWKLPSICLKYLFLELTRAEGKENQARLLLNSETQKAIRFDVIDVWKCTHHRPSPFEPEWPHPVNVVTWLKTGNNGCQCQKLSSEIWHPEDT